MKYIPLDKSWIIRMGILDLIYGYPDILEFLAAQLILSDDLVALKRACVVWLRYSKFSFRWFLLGIVWPKSRTINVGESGTLYRFLQFAIWMLGLKLRLKASGTLKKRKLSRDPAIVYLSQTALLNFPGEPTSQWASAAVLLGDKERLVDAPFKLKLTYEGVDHWYARRRKKLCWEPRYDETIRAQASAFRELLIGKRPNFTPLQPEDYCFARVFDYITRSEAEYRWPSLAGHESNRFEEVEKALGWAKAGLTVTSKDHRVVQAIVMWGAVHHVDVKVQYPHVVSKSWPEFPQFMQEYASHVSFA